MYMFGKAEEVERTYLEVYPTPGLALGLVGVVDHGPPLAVEDEPPAVPGLDDPPALAGGVATGPHLVQVAAAGAGADQQVLAGVQLVAGGLDVLPQVEVVVADRKVSGEGPLLKGQKYGRQQPKSDWRIMEHDI